MIKSRKSLASLAAVSAAALALLGTAPAASAAPTAGISSIDMPDSGSLKKDNRAKPSHTTYDVEGYGKVDGGSLSIDARGNAHKASGSAKITLDTPLGQETVYGNVNCLDEEGKDIVVATGTYKLRGDKKNVGVFVAVVADNGTQKKWGKKRGEPDRIGILTLSPVPKNDPLTRGLCTEISVFEDGLAPVLKGDFDVDVHKSKKRH
jgi:hypothetical protein